MADRPAITAAQADRLIAALDTSDGGHDEAAAFIRDLAEPVATKPFTYPPCESYKPGGDTCAHCGKDVGPHCEAQALQAARQVHDEAVVAFGCNEEAHGEVRCEKWCKSAICAASIAAHPPAPDAPEQPVGTVRVIPNSYVGHGSSGGFGSARGGTKP